MGLLASVFKLRDDSTHASGQVSHGDTHAEAAFTVWMTSEGLRSRNHHLTWIDLAALTDELASCVDALLGQPVEDV